MKQTSRISLHDLVAGLDDEALRDLGSRCLGASMPEGAGLLRMELERRLRQPDYVEMAVFVRRPPALAVWAELLAAPGQRLRESVLVERVKLRARRWRRGVTSGELLAHDANRELYRKVLRAAWTDDLQIDASEAGLLAILRRELGLRRAEHYLLAFHDSIAHLWDGGSEMADFLGRLAVHGLVWRRGEEVILADEMEAAVRRATGIELDAGTYGRLLSRLSSAVLRDALDRHGLAKSGSKSERVNRLIENLTLPSVVLESRELGRDGLAKLAKDLGLTTSHNKHELIAHVVDAFRNERDLTAAQPLEEELPVERKELSQEAFSALFRPLSNNELHALLSRLGLPLSGTKTQRIETLWESRFRARTILEALKGEPLRRIYREHGLSGGGKKAELGERLIAHLRGPKAAEPQT